MLEKNHPICQCGDCSAAMSRAYSIAEKMYADDECCNFQVAVAAYFYTIACAGIRDSILRQGVLPPDIPTFILQIATMDSVEAINERTKPLAVELNSEIISKVDRWTEAMYARLTADHAATKTDSAEIKGGPKAT